MILDSDVLIWLSRGDSDAIAWVDSTPDRTLSVVTLMKILQGMRSKTEMKNSQPGLIEEHTLAHGLQMPDALIAATAIEVGEVLATANLRHFRPIKRLALKPFHPRRK